MSDEIRSVRVLEKILKEQTRLLEINTDKFVDYRDVEGKTQADIDQLHRLRDWWVNAKWPLQDLSRYASQMIEHSVTETIFQIELRLLLATFESELKNAERLFDRPSEIKQKATVG